MDNLLKIVISMILGYLGGVFLERIRLKERYRERILIRRADAIANVYGALVDISERMAIYSASTPKTEEQRQELREKTIDFGKTMVRNGLYFPRDLRLPTARLGAAFAEVLDSGSEDDFVKVFKEQSQVLEKLRSSLRIPELVEESLNLSDGILDRLFMRKIKIPGKNKAEEE